MILKELKERWWRKVVEHSMESEATFIRVRGLKPEEAIGKPSRVDYPLLKGREVMLQAEVRGAYGQAFTDEPSDYVGDLSSLHMMMLNTNRDRALLVAAINATYKYLGLVTNTRHCINDDQNYVVRRLLQSLAQSFIQTPI